MNKTIQISAITIASFILIIVALSIWLERDMETLSEMAPPVNPTTGVSQATATSTSSAGSNPSFPAPTSPPLTPSKNSMTGKEFHERLENDEDFALAIIKAQVEKNPDAKHYMKGFAAAMFPLELHGIVIDDKNSGISDVTVTYKLGYPYGYGYTKEATVKTDKDGRFMIRDRANSLLIKQVQKDRFELLQREAEGQTFGLRASRGEKDWSDYPSGSPYRIIMSKKD